jgi:hypothetical protein
MRLLALFLVLIILSGCVGDNCFRSSGLGVNSSECQEYRATHERPTNPGIEWYEYIIFPLAIISATSGEAAKVNNSITSNPHYQAGGSAYKRPVAQITWRN